MRSLTQEGFVDYSLDRGDPMKRLIALIAATVALAACAAPTAPTPDPNSDAAKAHAVLHGASKLPATASGRLASN